METLQNTTMKWDEAASMVVDSIIRATRNVVETQQQATQESQDNIIEVFELLVNSIFHDAQQFSEDKKSVIFSSIASNGLIGYANETKVSVEEAGMHVLKTVIGKQRMYGHGNIARFGVPGLVIRLNDKLERLKNLQKHDGPVLFEPIHDTWLDICGYSVIAVMWVNGWFMLELDAE